MADGDLVRKITVTATGENIDSTKNSVIALEAATKALTNTTNELAKVSEEASSAYKDQTDSLDTSNDRFKITGQEAASVANHIKVATEAAYALSPAFRSMVNASVVPALRAVGTATAAATELIVLGVNTTGTALLSASAAAAQFGPRFEIVASTLNATGRAMEGFSITATGIASTILTRLTPILRGLAVAQFVIDSYQLAGEKLKEYADISNNSIGLCYLLKTSQSHLSFAGFILM